MNPFKLHSLTDRSATARWIASAAFIVAAHAGVIAAGVALQQETENAGVAIPAIMVDMAPAPSAPQVNPADAAPGPEMEQAEESAEKPPEPVKQAAIEEQITPTPPVEKPEVEAPPEKQVALPTPPPPEPQVTPEPPKPEPVKEPVKPEVKKLKKPNNRPPAPRTTSAPAAERVTSQAASMATAGAAAAAAALPSYRDRLAAHLQRYKQYPSEAKSEGRQGVAMLSFTVNRHGQVLSSRLARSSGVGALDEETLAMIRRAQPLPAFPPEMTQASLSFTVPVRFSIR